MTSRSWVLGLSALIFAVPAAAGGRRARPALTGYVVEKIADLATPIPEGTGSFIRLGVPAIDGGVIAFVGQGADGQSGVYRWENGVLSRIADRTTAVPGAPGTFTRFGTPGLDGTVSVAPDGSVAFVGNGGAYTDATGVLTPLVDAATPVPERPLSTFENVFSISYDGGQLAFTAVSTGFHQGLYLTDGKSVSLVADQATPIPGGLGTFRDFGLTSATGKPSLSAGDVVFTSNGVVAGGIPQSGVYGRIGGALVVIADRHTPLPGRRSATFGPFSDGVDIHNGTVAFRNADGIFRTTSAGLEKVVNERTRMPGYILPFRVFLPPAVEHGRVAFGGEFVFEFPPTFVRVLRVGLYSDVLGPLGVVVDSTRASRLDGRRIKQVWSGMEALSDGRITFRVILADDWQGVYLARPAEE
jgi:hypothetical protein